MGLATSPPRTKQPQALPTLRTLPINVRIGNGERRIHQVREGAKIKDLIADLVIPDHFDRVVINSQFRGAKSFDSTFELKENMDVFVTADVFISVTWLDKSITEVKAPVLGLRLNQLPKAMEQVTGQTMTPDVFVGDEPASPEEQKRHFVEPGKIYRVVDP